MQNQLTSNRIVVRIATLAEREEIYRLRHEVYARELGQHALNKIGSLHDPVDEFNIYIVASLNGVLAGFVSITPPGFGSYSVDKYLFRENFPELAGDGLHEVRLLTVTNRFRRREAAGLLMYAALRWIESQNGERIMAIGRREVLDLYVHVGLEKLGHQIRSGAVTYELLTASVARMTERIKSFTSLLNRLERGADWPLDIPFRKAAACFHGGAFFDAVGPEFDHLERRSRIINADVLDAWFPPSPRVTTALRQDLPWLLRTSPPTGCEGMVRAIARARGLSPQNILPGAGSSDLIFLVLRHWLTRSSRVLILDPTYGEYAHILEQVVRCRVDRISLSRENNYQLDLEHFASVAARGYDLIVLVNPNSPTGQHVPRVQIEEALQKIPVSTRVWVDETYIEYAGPNESIERFAAGSSNVVVCKSMSKVYALSGARVAYLCGPASLMEELRAINPPWAVSLLAQVAAVAALQDPAYYSARYAETHQLRNELAAGLSELTAWQVLPGVANFLLCHLPEYAPDAATIIKLCRARGLFLRDAGAMGRSLGKHTLRIAVKDADTNGRMLRIIAALNNRLLPNSNPLSSLQSA
jgi:histidinol-phosphate/aromatic aminotransferase/cobyric acid decarboxylase-like protein